jgi:hypothetical protein
MKRAWIILALGILGPLQESPAAVLTWTGTNSSDFYNVTNWLPMAVPGSGDTLNITNGQVDITPAFTSSGLVNWSGGQISGAMTVSNLMAVGGPAVKTLSAALTNWGTLTLSGRGNLSLGAVVVNQAGALFDVQGDITIIGVPGAQLINAGTLRKSAGNHVCTITNALQNTGTLSALSGTLDLQRGGLLGGQWTASSGASLTFSYGKFTLLESAVSTGPGFVGVTNGAVPSFGGLGWTSFVGTLGTTMGWRGGAIGTGETFTIGTNGVLAISGLSGSTPIQLGASVANNGTITLSGVGDLNLGSTIVNRAGGLFDVQGDLGIYGVEGVRTFVNAGTFLKSAGTNTCTMEGVGFQNTGTWAALSGTISYHSSFTSSAGVLAVQLNNTASWGGFNFGGPLKLLGGSLQVTLADGFAPSVGSSFQLFSSLALSGAFATLSLPQGASIVTSNNTVYLAVPGAVSPRLLTPGYSGGNFDFSISTANGQSYTIQHNDDLATTNWVVYTNFTGDGSVIQIGVPLGGVPRRFFRIREP